MKAARVIFDSSTKTTVEGFGRGLLAYTPFERGTKPYTSDDQASAAAMFGERDDAQQARRRARKAQIDRELDMMAEERQAVARLEMGLHD